VSLDIIRTIKQWRVICLAFYWVLLLGVMVIVCSVAFGADDDNPYARETLRGLRGIKVVIEHLKPHTERAGLRRSQIQTDVKLRLRKAGIRVLTLEEGLATPGGPYLYININSSPGTGPLANLVAFNIEVALKQSAFLTRNTAITTLGATTWSIGFLVGVHQEDVRQIRDYVGDLVDAFINDYLSVNRK
jgi:hypothetical protein